MSDKGIGAKLFKDCMLGTHLSSQKWIEFPSPTLQEILFWTSLQTLTTPAHKLEHRGLILTWGIKSEPHPYLLRKTRTQSSSQWWMRLHPIFVMWARLAKWAYLIPKPPTSSSLHKVSQSHKWILHLPSMQPQTNFLQTLSMSLHTFPNNREVCMM